MSESVEHRQLIELLILKAKEIICKDNWCLISSDTPECSSIPAQTSEGFRPDLFYEYQNLLVIGEAKTSNDVQTKHSKMQYESYIIKCSLFSGRAFFIAAVPWKEKAAVKNLLHTLQKKYPGNYKIIVCEGIGGAI